MNVPVELPELEQNKYITVLEYKGWDNVEQLEDVIGEEKTCDLYFGEDEELNNVTYDLKITIERVRRSKKQI